MSIVTFADRGKAGARVAAGFLDVQIVVTHITNAASTGTHFAKGMYTNAFSGGAARNA